MVGREAGAITEAFRAELEVNAGMRSRCTDRGSFKHEFSEWKQREEAVGRTHKCPASHARFLLSRRKHSRPTQPGRPRICVHNSGKVTVEEVAPLSPTTPSPPAVNRRQTQGEQQSPPSQEPDERETVCAMALRAELEVNARMRAGCTNRASFKRQYWLWQQRENVARHTRRVSASAALRSSRN